MSCHFIGDVEATITFCYPIEHIDIITIWAEKKSWTVDGDE